MSDLTDADIARMRMECDKAKQNAGALWTLISGISHPIRQCFRDRTMSFAEFQSLALAWEDSIAGESHPDTLRAERDALLAAASRERATRERMEAAVAAREAIDAAASANDELNLVDVVAAHRGWLPLVVGEQMTVGFGDGKEYTITRNPDRSVEQQARATGGAGEGE